MKIKDEELNALKQQHAVEIAGHIRTADELRKEIDDHQRALTNAESRIAHADALVEQLRAELRAEKEAHQRSMDELRAEKEALVRVQQQVTMM